MDQEHKPLVKKVEEIANNRGCSKVDKFLRRDVWFPLLLCTLNLVGQQAGGLKIIQGFQVEIFSKVYTNQSSQYHHNHAQHNSFNYIASVILGVVRLIAALITARYIKNFG